MNIEYSPATIKESTGNIDGSLKSIIESLNSSETAINSVDSSWSGNAKDKLFSKMKELTSETDKVITKADVCVGILETSTFEYVATDEKSSKRALELKTDSKIKEV